MFAGMPDVHDLHGSGKVFGHQPPDPGGSIPQDHQLVRPLQPILDSQGIEQRALVFRFRATSHIVLVPCLIHKHAWRQSPTFWPAGGLKDRDDFDFPIAHIPQFRERKNRIVNRPDQADEEPVDEELAAPEPGYANVNHCGCARGQCPQNIGKSSAS